MAKRTTAPSSSASATSAPAATTSVTAAVAGPAAPPSPARRASTSTHVLKQIDEHLATSNQAWLFGAGISLTAGIPLMYPLTERVRALAAKEPKALEILNLVLAELPKGSHIEHVLSHLCDYETLASRASKVDVTIGAKVIKLAELQSIHEQLLGWIAHTIRWGYVPKSPTTAERVGDSNTPIVDVAQHSKFVKAAFDRSQAGVADRRLPIKLFTTNYDTLLEDALALGSVPYWDGFSGGAIAFRSFLFGDAEPKVGHRAHVIKLHGSIDWYLDSDGRVLRVRESDCYPTKPRRVLIYPQATKYVATQRDPFAAQFELLRRALCTPSENVLVVCGYAFGDEHVNDEIRLALARPDNKTTVIALCKSLCTPLTEWLNSPFGSRIFVLAENGLWNGRVGPLFVSTTGVTREWWTFDGATRLLNDGAEVFVR